MHLLITTLSDRLSYPPLSTDQPTKSFLHPSNNITPQIPNPTPRRPIRIRKASRHPIMNHNRRVLCALDGIQTTRQTLNHIIRVPRKEERNTKAFLSTFVNNAVQIGQVLIIRPAHHHVSQVDYVCTRERSHVNPFRRSIIPYLESSCFVLEEDGHSAEVCVCSDS